MPEVITKSQVVLAHDSFTQLGGAERVVLGMAEAFPEASLFVVVADKRVLEQLPETVRRRVRTSPLQWVYRVFPKFQYLLPLIPLAVWLTRIPACDVLLSSSSAFAKGFRKPKRPSLSLRGGDSATTKQSTGSIETKRTLPPSENPARNDEYAIHINYCHTPTRFLWSDAAYVEQEVPWLLRLPARIFLRWMKQWDLQAAQEVDVFIANSQEVQQRIKTYYHRDSEIIYPFVDTEFWGSISAKRTGLRAESETSNDSPLSTVSLAPSPYFLIAGRLHAHKHNDLVVRVCTRLGFALHVAGSGRDEVYLRSIAGPTVQFLGRVSDEVLRQEYSAAEAYIFPQLEDFGLMPVEAAACGTPTIGLDAGGTRETIIPGVTGEWFSQGNEEELAALLQTWDKKKYKTETLVEHAKAFGKERFMEQLKEIVTRKSVTE